MHKGCRQDPSSTSVKRVFTYLRVSTGRQAETDLSIPDQRRQVEAWASSRALEIVGHFQELGASATDDKRPEFQRMIEEACGQSRPVDAILVHSFSRFMRDSFAFEFYVRRLGKHGVRLLSITQEVGEDDPAQLMMRKVIALFDEYQSQENAKHVLRSMKENARQGYWNGSRPPFGYATVSGEQRGARLKKRLAVDLVEAEVVRRIFRLFLEGNNGSGPMGVKAITSWLNKNGYRTRAGANWGVGPVHALLTNTVYAGQGRFNRTSSRTRARKPESEVVTYEAPVIIDPAVFEQVQAGLKQRNPRVTPPRVVSGPILLTGMAYCALCDGAMTLRTGTSRNGKVHRYYTCSTCARAGKSACKGRSIRLDKLDRLVTSQLIDRVLAPDRLRAILEALAARRAAQAEGIDERVTALEVQAEEADTRLRRLYKLVEDGNAEVDDALKERLTVLKAARETARAAVERARGTKRLTNVISPAKLETFGHLMRERLTTGNVPFRKAYLSAIIDRVEVDDGMIRIRGRKDVLEAAVAGGSTPGTPVRSFVRKWRTR